jgi:inorganic triphosphatase YgiF
MAKHRSQLEIERKYDVDADLPTPHLVGVGAIAVEKEPQTAELVATYYDTEDLRLARQRIAVRARRGGSDEGWHVKLPPEEEGRTELHWPLGDGEQPPEDLLEAVRDELGDGRLIPVARVTNVRVTTVLTDAAGFELAELCDDHVHSENLLSGATDAWREWEVELLSGAPDSRERRTALLDGIEAELLAAGARPSASASKLQRALGL